MLRIFASNDKDVEIDDGFDTNIAVQEAPPKLDEPKRYKVILVNDDFTPMEFVVEILTNYFSLDQESATRVMLNVHTKGKGVCGIYTKEVAETKVVIVNEVARENQHPLLCTMEVA